MKLLFYSLLFVVSYCPLLAQMPIDVPKVQQSVLASGNVMLKAYEDRDYALFVEFMHPRIIEMGGGKDVAINALEGGGFPPGMELISTELARPEKILSSTSIVKMEDEDSETITHTLQCVLRQQQVILVDGQKYSLTSSLIGISYDNGERWYFITPGKKTFRELKMLFPDLLDALEIEEQGPPVLIY